MLGSDELKRILAAPHESETVEFKREFGLTSKRARLELAKDVVCLANRSGGSLVFGIGQVGNTLEVVGLPVGDEQPDPTDLNRLLAKHFRPNPIVTVATFEIDGRHIGVVAVPQFVSTPHICSSDGHDSENTLVLRQGDVYRRSDAFECERAGADSMAALIDAAVVKRGATYVEMDRPGPDIRGDRSSWRPTTSTSDRTLRALHLEPDPDSADVDVRDLRGLVERATVHYRVGTAAVPRQIDVQVLGPDQVVRESDRVAVHVEKPAFGRDALTRSSLTINRSLHVDIRESLWEDADYGDEAKQIDITSLLGFTYASLAFARRLYAAAQIRGMRIGIGILAATGRTLTTSAYFSGFTRPYVITASEDVWVVRAPTVEALGDPGQFIEAAKSIFGELLWYFGFEPEDNVFEAQLKMVRQEWFSTNVAEGIVAVTPETISEDDTGSS